MNLWSQGGGLTNTKIIMANIFYSLINYRPKLCLEKCDANISTKVLMVHQPPTTATNTLANDSPVCPNNNCIDLTTDEDKPAKVDQPAVNSSDIKVPKQYEHILQKPAFVKLIKYDNIEKELKTSGTQAHSKR